MIEARGYVLAGGRSTRMGVDKADLRLGGRTFLEIAVEHLQGSCAEVVIVGEGRAGLPGVRVIGDFAPECGPIGGMAAALTDLQETGAVEWAAFLPVDMPLLPAGLMRGMVAGGAVPGTRLVMLETEGRRQPLLSLVHRSLGDGVREAVERGERKVLPVLEGAARSIGSIEVRRWPPDPALAERAWIPQKDDLHTQSLWFANLNTPEEFAAAEVCSERWENKEEGIGAAWRKANGTRRSSRTKNKG